MYQILLDNLDGERPLILHDSRSNSLRVIEPKCDLELNKTGTLTFKMYPSHKYFNSIKKLHSEISFYQDGKWLFTGRVLNDEVDINNVKTVECEGIMGYFLDSIQRNKEYGIRKSDGSGIGFKAYLEDVIKNHNSQVNSEKHFKVGFVTSDEIAKELDTIWAISSYDDTLSVLQDNIIDKFNKVYLMVSVDSSKQKIIELKTINDLEVNNQVIQFGKNLLDFTSYVKGEDIATAIIPLGKSQGNEDTESGETLDTKLTINEIPDNKVCDDPIIYKSGDYIYDYENKDKYGLIFKTAEFSEVEDDKDLLKKAIEKLKYYRNFNTMMEITALDLHFLDVNVDAIRLGQKIQVISRPHNINGWMIVKKMSINIDSPDKTTITLSTEERSNFDYNNSVTKKSADNDTKNKKVNKKVDGLDYITPSDLKSYLPSNLPKYFDSKIGSGDIDDLSRYALKSDVQNAFNTLSSLIRGI